ncbi:MAG: hypothetical protein ACI9J2_002780 [Saprospiraceae bacterium]|jgi:uncharacterized protein (DUF1330 family)
MGNYMSDAPVYMVVNLTIEDTEEYGKYVKGFFDLLKKYGGSFMGYDDNVENFEGFSPRNGRMVIFSFPSEEVAKNWYADTEYQALSEYRRAGTRLDFLTMVRGVPPS